MNKSIPFFLFSMLFLLSSFSNATEYYDPNQMRINPNTNKAFINQRQPVWDGVYPQADGSTIWIRNGVATRHSRQPSYQSDTNKPFMSNTQEPAHFCADLVRLSCGARQECQQVQACKIAQQMEKLKREEDHFSVDQIARYGKVMDKKCQAELSNIMDFPHCNTKRNSNNICQKLVKQSCGNRNQCQSKTACHLSKQLLHRQQEEQLQNAYSNKPIQADKECRIAMTDNRLFPACQ